jgi:hypothetical protein
LDLWLTFYPGRCPGLPICRPDGAKENTIYLKVIMYLYLPEYNHKMIRRLLLILVLFLFELVTFAQENIARPNKNFVSIDLVPLYYDFFDYRKQIRMGVDYSRQFKTHWFVNGAIDCGLFDDYTFTKYYDFFNQGTGYHYIREDALITGFHFLPSGNYFFWQSKSKPGQGMYCSAILDLNFYRKKTDIYNSQTLENSSDVIKQFKTGAGVSLGGKCNIGRHFFTEIRTSIFGKIFFITSDKNINAIRSINAQWNSNDYNFWWVSNLKLGYAF